jgi:hypothetical protein
MAQEYEYKPLTESDALRLIDLQPSEDDPAAIRCSLVHTTLSECEARDIFDRYTALSYVWGCADKDKTIWIDDLPLPITANLFSALSDLRHQTKRFLIWADGICINQNDNDEKARQVRIMGQIYDNALHTVIYLGAARDEDPEALCLTAIRNGEAPSGVNTLMSILSKDWFIRVWIFQELVFSANPLVQCGKVRAKWDSFHDSFLSTLPLIGPVPQLIQERIKIVSEMHRTRHRYQFRPTKATPHSTILDLLRTRRGMGVTDRRDLIFAHVGFASDGEKLTVDYSKQYPQLYAETAQYLAVKHGVAELLMCTGHSQTTTEDWPSWISNWSIPGPPTPYSVGGSAPKPRRVDSDSEDSDEDSEEDSEEKSDDDSDEGSNEDSKEDEVDSDKFSKSDAVEHNKVSQKNFEDANEDSKINDESCVEESNNGDGDCNEPYKSEGTDINQGSEKDNASSNKSSNEDDPDPKRDDRSDKADLDPGQDDEDESEDKDEDEDSDEDSDDYDQNYTPPRWTKNRKVLTFPSDGVNRVVSTSPPLSVQKIPLETRQKICLKLKKTVRGIDGHDIIVANSSASGMLWYLWAKAYHAWRRAIGKWILPSEPCHMSLETPDINSDRYTLNVPLILLLSLAGAGFAADLVNKSVLAKMANGDLAIVPACARVGDVVPDLAYDEICQFLFHPFECEGSDSLNQEIEESYYKADGKKRKAAESHEILHCRYLGLCYLDIYAYLGKVEQSREIVRIAVH